MRKRENKTVATSTSMKTQT